MPRPPRIQFPNAYYHVMNRGIDKKQIFFNDHSYEVFLEILGEACKKFGVIIYSYCLMPNHYHLLLKTPNANLGKMMQHVNGFYTQRYNKFMEKDGPLFRGRFKSILVDKDSYLLSLARYIHRNPIGLVENLKYYKWSSYPAYLKLAKCPAWLDKSEILQIMNVEKDVTKYEEFVNNEWPSDKGKDVTEIYGKKKNLPFALGGEEFKSKVNKKGV